MKETSIQQRRRIRLETAIHWMVERHGYENCGFLTLTFRENVVEWDEAERRFASFEKNVLSEYAKDWACVVEFQGRGAIHYHLIIGLDRDIRTGTNIKIVKDRKLPKWIRYSRENVSENLRYFWDVICQRAQGKRRGERGVFEQVSDGYGFGRVELMPLEKAAGGRGGLFVGIPED